MERLDVVTDLTPTLSTTITARSAEATPWLIYQRLLQIVPSRAYTWGLQMVMVASYKKRHLDL